MRLKYLSLAVIAAFTSCSQYAAVSMRKAVYAPPQPSAADSEDYGKYLKRAAAKKNPWDSLGDYLLAARDAENRLGKSPDDADARYRYNFAVSRLFTALGRSGTDPWSKPLQVATDQGAIVLDCRRDPRKGWNPSLYDFVPVDELDFDGLYVKQRSRKDGLGASLVAMGKADAENYLETFSVQKIYYGVTAMADFRGDRCTISFEDPLSQESVSLDGKSYPLAADFTAPIAVMLSKTNPKEMELSRLLRPEKYAETARISRLQPYDPKKTVVLVIHGLKDSPATWAPMINRLREDDKIRANYQFWFYSYPSGYAYPYSAAILRRQLDEVERKFKLSQPMVVIGHSMGGCISRLLITDAGDRIWRNYFNDPPDKVMLGPKTRQVAEESLIFNHRPEVGRVIFIAAPLKGSDLASGWIQWVTSRLIRAPLTLLDVSKGSLKAVGSGGESVRIDTLPNSVDTLSPSNRFVREINRLPLTPGIPYHTIMGDRGKGGNKNHTPPVQSDGIVPYWSSHMEGAVSEKVVPSSHSAHQNSEAISEVGRILRTYAPAR